MLICPDASFGSFATFASYSHVRFAPHNDRRADVPGCRLRAISVTTASQRTAAKRSLFDNLIGAAEQRDRHGNAERLCGVEVDDELRTTLGILGAVQDGLCPSGYYYPLAIKGVMDGLATMGFISIFGWGSILAAVPVLAFQGSLTLLCAQVLAPYLTSHGWLESVDATSGMLVFCVALIILDLKKIELADYLPSLAFAPLLTWALT